MPRLGIEIPKEMEDDMKNKLPWGLRQTILLELVRSYLAAYNDYGPVIEYYTRSGNIEIKVKEDGKTT